MSASDPWLVHEMRFIADTIAFGKPVLGICLGTQLIAKALGCVRLQESIQRNWLVFGRAGYLNPENPGEVVASGTSGGISLAWGILRATEGGYSPGIEQSLCQSSIFIR